MEVKPPQKHSLWSDHIYILCTHFHLTVHTAEILRRFILRHKSAWILKNKHQLLSGMIQFVFGSTHQLLALNAPRGKLEDGVGNLWRVKLPHLSETANTARIKHFTARTRLTEVSSFRSPGEQVVDQIWCQEGVFVDLEPKQNIISSPTYLLKVL